MSRSVSDAGSKPDREKLARCLLRFSREIKKWLSRYAETLRKDGTAQEYIDVSDFLIELESCYAIQADSSRT